MKIPSLLLGGFLAVALATTCLALTTDREVTLAYVREHPKEFSVKVAKDTNGLISFTVVITLPVPRYVVAHLLVRSGERVLARSDTPAFTKNSENTFHFSMPPECLPTSEFNLGVAGFAISVGYAVPMPGTIEYRFRLLDFVSPELLKTSNNK